MTKLNNAVMLLDMSLVAAKAVLAESKEPLQRRLAWLGQELERLAGEAYRLADEAGDDPGSRPTDWSGPLPGFDPEPGPYTCGICCKHYEHCDCASTGRR